MEGVEPIIRAALIGFMWQRVHDCLPSITWLSDKGEKRRGLGPADPSLALDYPSDARGGYPRPPQTAPFLLNGSVITRIGIQDIRRHISDYCLTDSFLVGGGGSRLECRLPPTCFHLHQLSGYPPTFPYVPVPFPVESWAQLQHSGLSAPLAASHQLHFHPDSIPNQTPSYNIGAQPWLHQPLGYWPAADIEQFQSAINLFHLGDGLNPDATSISEPFLPEQPVGHDTLLEQLFEFDCELLGLQDSSTASPTATTPAVENGTQNLPQEVPEHPGCNTECPQEENPR
ncbi:hypothetical protein QBC47DRAFT_364849 [Echria macrotheca]|uniref:Uncharacterized protein n=1 Tax=Echria macrotheca TaxID=438768 RepID=A0AAJ0B453_9PEZI|nr:hypothetical protein QBC47DRAFT_364849 [Echria macrotheca]